MLKIGSLIAVTVPKFEQFKRDALVYLFIYISVLSFSRKLSYIVSKMGSVKFSCIEKINEVLSIKKRLTTPYHPQVSI